MTELRTKKSSDPVIELDASTMAGTWNVSFRNGPKGFSAWLTVGGGILDSVKTHTMHKSLTWRLAAEVLADMYEDGLQGDWVDQIVVTGLDGWRAEMLKMAAITGESPYYDRLLLLLELDDSDIETVATTYGTLLSDEAEQYILANWGDDRSNPESIPQCVDEIHHLVTITDKPAPDSLAECVNLLNLWSEAKEKPYATRTNHVSWSDQRSWFVWLFTTAPKELIWEYENQGVSRAKALVAWLRSSLAHSHDEIIRLRASRNQAAQIGIGLAATFIDLTTVQLKTYYRLSKEPD